MKKVKLRNMLLNQSSVAAQLDSLGPLSPSRNYEQVKRRKKAELNQTNTTDLKLPSLTKSEYYNTIIDDHKKTKRVISPPRLFSQESTDLTELNKFETRIVGNDMPPCGLKYTSIFQ